MKTSDHAGVWVPPPLLFVSPLVAAAALESVVPRPIFAGGGMASMLGGLVVVAAAVALGLSSVASFRRMQTTILPAGRPTTSIVDRGAYAFTRNPMYLAMALAYLGLMVVLNTLWALGAFPVVVAVVDRLVIRREERYLAGKFGEAYVSYCRRVRRWI
jgi:protein-S-isoprenylcysteine O-methyltransferase Ste14